MQNSERTDNPCTTSNSHFTENEIVPSIDTDFTSSSKTLLIAFGSMRLNHKVPPFEFVSAFKEMPAQKLFVRDPHQFWYQRGLPGISGSLKGTGAHLQNLVAQLGVDKVVTFGGSMGGYAALYFGWYLQANEVHAFSPKTFLAPLMRLIHGDIRHPGRHKSHPLNRKIMQLQRDPQVENSSLDLKRVLENANQKTKYFIYFNQRHRVDRVQCKRLKDMPGIELRHHDQGGHRILIDMKRSGQLEEIIRSSL